MRDCIALTRVRLPATRNRPSAVSRPATTGAENRTLLLVKVAQDLVARPPTDAEITAFTGGAKTLDQMVDGWLGSADFRSYAYASLRRRLWKRIEAEGLPSVSALLESAGVRALLDGAGRLGPAGRGSICRPGGTRPTLSTQPHRKPPCAAHPRLLC